MGDAPFSHSLRGVPTPVNLRDAMDHLSGDLCYPVPMPLAHQSISHGTVAFGFFNIESHMLLLEELFFFADDFCAAVVEVISGADRAELAAWTMDKMADRGNLHGAIAGQDLSGFIGATYRARPFPELPRDFKQNPEGTLSREAVEEMIAPFGHARQIALARKGPRFDLGQYGFDVAGFLSLVAYVDRGGYPRWRDERRPPYVTRMVQALPADPGQI